MAEHMWSTGHLVDLSKAEVIETHPSVTMWCGVTGVTRLDCVRSEEIRKVLKQEAVVTQVKRKREWWKYKVMENHGSLLEKVMRGQVEKTKKKTEQFLKYVELCRII